ncbi:MAG: site-specific integrase [Pirellulales bacterium]
MLVAYWTGLRRSSLCKLHCRDVDLKTGWLNVPGDKMKNRRGKRFRLGADAIKALQGIWSAERKYLFPFPSTRHFFRQLGRVMRALGVAPSTRRTATMMHKMRRTVATLAAAKRGLAAACDLLGHGTVEVTKRYIDTSKLPGHDATEFLPTITDANSAPEVKAPERTHRTPNDFHREALQLLALGFDLPAGMLARVALERWVHGLAYHGQCSLRGRDGIGLAAITLAQNNIITDAALNRVRAIAKPANAAAHGRNLERSTIENLLQSVGALLAEFPLPITSESCHAEMPRPATPSA